MCSLRHYEHGRGVFAALCLRNTRRRVLGRSWRFGVFDSSGFCGEAGIGSLGSVSRQCHANYWVDSARSGLSYGAETLALLCDFAFVSLGLHRVVVEILPANTASLKTAARVGFVHEGTARRIYLKDGQWQDYEIFALSSEDWPTPESSVLL